MDEYIEYIKNELIKLKQNNFVGSINIKVHFKDGNIGNIVINQEKHIKFF